MSGVFLGSESITQNRLEYLHSIYIHNSPEEYGTNSTACPVYHCLQYGLKKRKENWLSMEHDIIEFTGWLKMRQTLKAGDNQGFLNIY